MSGEIKPVRCAVERLLWRAVLICLCVVFFVVLVPSLWSLLSPFIIALAVVASLQPLIRFVQERLKLKRKLASAILLLITVALALLLLYWFCAFAVVQIINVSENAPAIIGDIIGILKGATDKLLGMAQALPDSIGDSIRASLNNAFTTLSNAGMTLAGSLVNGLIAFATKLPYAFIYANFLIMALIFISSRYQNIRAYIVKRRDAADDESFALLRKSAVKGMMGYIRVQLLFSLLCCLLSWVFFQSVGFQYTFLIAFTAALLELIPQFGCGTLYIPWSILCFIVGQSRSGWFVLGLYFGFCLIRRVTEPTLLGTNLGVSPLASLIGMFVGMRTGGVMGLILGPIVMVILVSALRARLFDGILRDAKIIAYYFKDRWKINKGESNNV